MTFFKTHEKYSKQVENTWGDKIVVCGKYTRDDTAILHQCAVCKTIWNAYPTNILQKRGCPKCGHSNTAAAQTKSNDQYLEEVAEVSGCKIQVVGNYIGARKPIKHKCAECEHTWLAAPTNILKGRGCPVCKLSHGEKKISKILKKMGLLFEVQKTLPGCASKAPLRFDFYLTDLNVCIEYDGEQHSKPAEFFGGEDNYIRTVCRDAVKDHYCETNQIPLIRIDYTEFDKIEESLLESFIYWKVEV